MDPKMAFFCLLDNMREWKYEIQLKILKDMQLNDEGERVM